MKYIKFYEDFNKIFYSTSSPITISEFIETEVDERGNYDIDDVNEWISKYGIKSNTNLIWVSDKPYIAARYSMPAEEWDDAEDIYNSDKDSYKVDIFTNDDGTIIDESNDGDDGYLMILNK